MASSQFPSQPDWLLPSLVDHRAKIEPDLVWTEYPVQTDTYDDGFTKVTYKAFANAVNGAAKWIEDTMRGKSSDHEVLAYIGPSDVRYIIFVVAAVKAGYVLLLISPRNSLAAQLNLFQETGCRKLVTTFPEHPSMQQLAASTKFPVFHVPALDQLLRCEHAHYPYEKTFSQSKNEPLVVLHTSGSTGLPKPIVYTHAFAATWKRMFTNAAPNGYFTLHSLLIGVRMFFMLPPFHAAGVLIHLMHAVFNKTTIVVPISSTPPTAQGLAEALKYVQVDVAFGTPLTCLELDAEPEVLDAVAAKLPLFFYGGGDCPKAIGDRISEKIKFFTAVGYTECGSFNQIRPVGPWSNEWKYIEIDPDMNAEFRLVHDNLYQHWVVRKPECEHVQAPFALFPELHEYTSKDLFSPHPTKPNLWTHRGRADDIIVFLNGEKTNPISFEATVKEAPSVNEALVIGDQRFQAALMIESKAPVDTTIARAELLEEIWPFIEKANAVCPAHARVTRSHVLFVRSDAPMPRAGKGTVQRAPTVELYRGEINKLYGDASEQSGATLKPPRSLERATVAEISESIRESVLKVAQRSDIQSRDDFFSLGMDSLQVLMLVRTIKMTYKSDSLAPSVVYTNPNIEALAHAMKRLAVTEQAGQAAEREGFVKAVEGSIAKHIRKLESLGALRDRKLSTDGAAQTILLTGSTGNIGSYLLQALLADSSVDHVYCFNRKQTSGELQSHRSQARAQPEPQVADHATYLTGDLSLPSFDLEDDDYQNLLSKVTKVYHCAWPVNFNKSLDSFERNLDGVVNLIDFSLQASKLPEVVFISSVSAALGLDGSSTSAPILENIFTSSSAPLQNGYGASKHIAERLFAHASEKLGVSSTIIRVGQVAGPADGKGIWPAHEWLPSLVISSATLDALPDGFGVGSPDDQIVDWIPIDVLATTIVELTVSRSNPDAPLSSQAVYNLCNPQTVAWFRILPGVQKAVSAATGREIQVVSFGEWIEKVKESQRTPADKFGADAASKIPAVKLLEFYEGLLEKSASGHGVAVFETKKAVSKSKSLRELGPITAGLMEKWIAGWKLE